MAYALEFQFDPATDAALRRLWALLEERGLATSGVSPGPRAPRVDGLR